MRFLFLFITLCFANMALAETLTVGISPNAPFTYKDHNGKWTGLSVVMWEEFADRYDHEFIYKEMDGTTHALKETQSGEVDLAIGPISITSERSKFINFSMPYHTTGLGIAVKKEPVTILDTVSKFSKQIGYLLLFIFTGGIIVFLVERKDNDLLDTIEEGLWYSIVTATTTGYGDLVPKTKLGRLVGAVWMFASALYFPMLVAGISTSMTLEEYRKIEVTSSNIQDFNIGSVQSTTSAEYFNNKGIDHRQFTSSEHLLDALELGKIDVAVFDRPVLQHESKRRKDLLVLPNTLDTQYYGVVFPKKSLDISEQLDYFIPSFINSSDWSGAKHTFLGNQ